MTCTDQNRYLAIWKECR